MCFATICFSGLTGSKIEAKFAEIEKDKKRISIGHVTLTIAIF